MGAKTLLFGTSYFDDLRQWSQRYARWLAHCRALPLGFAAIVLIDDGSPRTPREPGLAVLDAADVGRVPLPGVSFVRFADNLGRQDVARYPGWWRSFQFSLTLAQAYGFDKIVHVESDAYLLSRRVLRYIDDLASGWTAFWCPRWNCAETALQVICRDRFEDLARLRAAGPHAFHDRAAELVIPFTHIEKGFVGDRYGEYTPRIPRDADYAVQVLPEMRTWIPGGLWRRFAPARHLPEIAPVAEAGRA